MTAFYNEIDPYAAQWLRNLIEAGHIAPGVVDERSIEDIKPDELMGYTQCHFFAGVGVWSLALRRAGWPDNRPVWTGSCPCQPFSAAGAGAGFADPRHLWPSFAWLIKQCAPPVVIGEQVASKAVEPWVDLVHADLEALGYAFGAIPFPSAGVCAPHIRDRLYWVADSGGARLEKRIGVGRVPVGQIGAIARQAAIGTGVRGTGGLANANGGNPGAERQQHGRQLGFHPQHRGDVRAIGQGARFGSSVELVRPSPVNGLWSDADWLFCRDGKWRPVEPGTFPLAHGAASRVGRLRAYGNAIVAPLAEEFTRAYLADA